MADTPQTQAPNKDLPMGNDDDPHGNWQDSQTVLSDHLNELATMAGYVARQTNPYTGGPIPQPTIGQGSANRPAVPAPPGGTSGGGT